MTNNYLKTPQDFRDFLETNPSCKDKYWIIKGMSDDACFKTSVVIYCASMIEKDCYDKDLFDYAIRECRKDPHDWMWHFGEKENEVLIMFLDDAFAQNKGFKSGFFINQYEVA